jgi:PadR family transcriptional regulator PadR
MPSPRFPIPQGTLDILILQILSPGPAHGYGIAQRLEQKGREAKIYCAANLIFEDGSR